MKSRETKQKDLVALTEQLSTSNSAMIVSFSKATVNKDQEFRDHLRAAGANYQVVKNTLARIAVKGTPFEHASEYFKGVTAIAWTENDAVVLSKAVSKFIKDNAGVYTFKAGVVDGKVVDLKQVESIASLPSKEVLMSKLLFVINAQAQRIVTVINAVPRNLAVVVKLIGEAKPAATEAAPVVKAEEPAASEEAKAGTSAPAVEETAATPVEASPETDAPAAETAEAPAEAASAAEVSEENAPEATAEQEPAVEGPASDADTPEKPE